ncbi:MAG: PAS domain S-box protein [Methanomassiliicoccus sp.]|nr:PAS domain S-box protein [Methanomassiliicoccus sp.]
MIRVLHIDDEKNLLDQSKSFLELSEELQVDIAISVGMAEERLSSAKYDIIISDYQMPETNGIEFLKRLRAQGIRIPFILFTGKGREEVVIEALNEGADFYIQKGGDPQVQFRELEQKVKEAVNRRRGEEAIIRLNNHLQAAMDLTRIATWSLDTGLRVLTVDDAAWAIIGTDAQRENGHNITFERFLSTFVHPDDRHKLQTHLDMAQSNPEIKTLENHFRITRLDGQVRHVDVFSVLDRESGHGAQTMFGVIQDVTKRMAAEETQRISEEKFSKVFHGSAAPMVITRLRDGLITDVNDATLAMFANRRDNALGLTTFELNAWYDLEDRKKILREVIDKGSVRDREVRFRRLDGQIISTLYYADLISINGEDAVLSSMMDITERKNAEEARRSSEIKYRQLVDSASEMIMVMQDGVFKMANPKLVEIIGAKDENELLSKSVLLHVHPDDRRIASERIQRRMRGEAFSEPFGIRMLDNKGGTHWLNNNQVPIEWEGRPAVMILLTDITEEKKARNLIERNLKFYHSMLDLANAPMFFKDRSRQYKECNAAFEAFLGIPKGKIIGHTVHEVFAREQADIYFEADEQVFREKKNQEYESKVRYADGTLHEVIFRKAPYFDDQGEVEGIIGVFFDVTELRRAEAASRIANQKLNLLSGITRHDIKNQLTALDGYIQISMSKLRDVERLKEIIAKEMKISDSISRQIDFTKDYEELGVRSPIWQNVARLAMNAADSLPMNDVILDVRCPDVEIFADPLVGKVFTNLIDNSLRYGGKKMAAIRIFIENKEGDLSIIYEDDGEGICPDDQKKMFTKGFGKHTGLGLFLSREILSITGIMITENGTQGKGARFEILVPRGGWRHTDGESGKWGEISSTFKQHVC